MNSPADSTLLNMQYYPDIKRNRSVVLQRLTEHGTPIFLCERANLVARYQALQQSLEAHWARHAIGYSFKTNYLVAQCGVLQELGAWAEVVSGREYRLARELGYAGPSIVFNGPLKMDDDLCLAIEDGALININDHDELDRMIRLAPRGGVPLEVGLRISSTLPRLGHSRFGFSLENDEASSAVQKIRDSGCLELVALHTHVYGDTDDAEIYGTAAGRLGEFAQRHIPDYQRVLKFLDVGGGYPAHSPKPKSRSAWSPQPIDTYMRSITEALSPFFPQTESRPTLIVEPGRYLTCDAILLVTRVVHVKHRDNKRIVNCDGSISMVPLTYYCPQIIHAFTPQLIRREGSPIDTVIHGSTCRENDILHDGPFPEVEPGDYLVHFAAGAYNSSLSPDFIFASPEMKLF